MQGKVKQMELTVKVQIIENHQKRNPMVEDRNTFEMLNCS